MNQETLELILGRKEHRSYIDRYRENLVERYKDKSILITGGNGSLGNALADWFDANGITSYHLLDIDTNNTRQGRRVHDASILKFTDMEYWVKNSKADYIFHFAAAKHAPVGEEEPWDTTMINVYGTQNIIRAAQGFGENTKVILSSTCKSIAPETCYGATKLIAERLVLNAGYAVARYYNVVQSSGNVFEIWENSSDTLWAMECYRYFISLDEAVFLTLMAGVAGRGRYSIDPGQKRYIPDICEALYGGDFISVPRRRGDRLEEPKIGVNEKIAKNFGPILKIENYND